MEFAEHLQKETGITPEPSSIHTRSKAITHLSRYEAGAS